MDEVPLIEKVQKNDINTTIIAIKKQLKELNALLGLIDIQSDKQDLSPYVRKDEVIDEVKRFDLSPVTSNAVSKAISYSISEVKTGAVWIDEKPIYCCVIPFSIKQTISSNSSLTMGTAFPSTLPFGNFDSISNFINGFIYRNNRNTIIPVGVQYNSSTQIQVSSPSVYSDTDGIILEYTKTV